MSNFSAQSLGPTFPAATYTRVLKLRALRYRVNTGDAACGDQVALIQQHFQQKAIKFQEGNYSEPTKLHGTEMSGQKDLQAGAAQIKISRQRSAATATP